MVDPIETPIALAPARKVAVVVHDYPRIDVLSSVVKGVGPEIVLNDPDVRECSVRVWFRYPMQDDARLDFQIQYRYPKGEWTGLYGGSILSRTVNGVLPKAAKEDVQPYGGCSVEHWPALPGTALRVVISDIVGDPWYYAAEVSA